MLFGDLVKYRAPLKGPGKGWYKVDLGMAEATWMLLQDVLRDPKDHINIRISHSGCKAQYEGDTRNTVL